MWFSNFALILNPNILIVYRIGYIFILILIDTFFSIFILIYRNRILLHNNIECSEIDCMVIIEIYV